jgi:hypothetical protein
VGSDKEERDEKSRHVLRKLMAGDIHYLRGLGRYRCPFCDKQVPENYDAMLHHAVGVGDGSVNSTAHTKAKHAAYGVFLQKLVAKEKGVVDAQPLKKQK